MKYLKRFNENVDLSVTLQLKKKLEEYSYILEDEGFYPNLELRGDPNLGFVHISILGYSKSDLYAAESDDDFNALLASSEEKIANLIKSEYYDEWLDRTSEACEKFNRIMKQVTMAGISGGEGLSTSVFFRTIRNNIYESKYVVDGKIFEEIGDNAIQAVDDLKYILEDEGYKLKYDKIVLSSNGRVIKNSKFTNQLDPDLAKAIEIIGKNSVVLINVDLADISKSLNRKDLENCEFYQEFFERLTEECKRLGYKTFTPDKLLGRARDHKYPDIIFIYNHEKPVLSSSIYDYYLNIF